MLGLFRKILPLRRRFQSTLCSSFACTIATRAVENGRNIPISQWSQTWCGRLNHVNGNSCSRGLWFYGFIHLECSNSSFRWRFRDVCSNIFCNRWNYRGVLQNHSRLRSFNNEHVEHLTYFQILKFFRLRTCMVRGWVNCPTSRFVESDLVLHRLNLTEGSVTVFSNCVALFMNLSLYAEYLSGRVRNLRQSIIIIFSYCFTEFSWCTCSW